MSKSILMPWKKLKLDHDHDSVRSEQPCSSSNCTNSPQTSLFCSLPAEILRKIFNYLNPCDLISIRELSIERFTDISLTVKHADFSGCNTVQAEDVSAFFTKDRVPYIQEINFNNLIFVKNSTLEKYILKCKHLKKLSVYEAGLTHANIYSIICGCHELEELYWSVMKLGSFCRKSPLDPIVPRLKKLYLNVRSLTEGFEIISHIVKEIGSSVEICLNLSSCFTTSLPPCMNRNIFVGKRNDVFSGPFNVIFRNESLLRNIETTLFRTSVTADQIGDGLISDNINKRKQKDLSSIVTSHSSFLQVLTEVKDLNAIPSLPPDSIHSLVLIMTDAKLCLESHIEMLSRITGSKLENFAVHNITRPFNLNPYVLKLESNMQRDLVTKIASTCVNIQVLNLSDLHCHEPFCFQSLFHLTKLKVLSLSACFLKTGHTACTMRPDSKEATAFQLQVFEDFVLKTKNIERFSFYGCLNCSDGPTDEEIMSISKWPKLTHLLISKVNTFRLCQFLLRVANSCPYLTSLEIIEVGPVICLFVPYVLHVLRTSKQLTFLRINQKAFNPVDNLFWKNIAMAKNLQGLCLSFDLRTVVENKMITDALVKLPFIHLFHLQARRIACNLSSQVNHIMNLNGIQNKRIEITQENATYSQEECLFPHFLL